MAWQQPDLTLVPPPQEGAPGYRLGELVLLPHPGRTPCAEELVARVVSAGYQALPGTPEWHHFRPLSTWWHGVGRHARLRSGQLHVRVYDSTPAKGGIYTVGLLTVTLERSLGALGALYAPAAG